MSAETQHVTLVGDSALSLEATFMRCGMPRIKVTVRGRTDPGYRVVMETQITNQEVTSMADTFRRLAELIAENKEAPCSSDS